MREKNAVDNNITYVDGYEKLCLFGVVIIKFLQVMLTNITQWPCTTRHNNFVTKADGEQINFLLNCHVLQDKPKINTII